MNNAIRRKIRKQNHIYKKAKKTNSKSFNMRYKKMRNEIVKLMRKSKRDNLQKMMTQGKKQFWRTIKFLNKNKSQIPTLKAKTLLQVQMLKKLQCLTKFYPKISTLNIKH